MSQLTPFFCVRGVWLDQTKNLLANSRRGRCWLGRSRVTDVARLTRIGTGGGDSEPKDCNHPFLGPESEDTPTIFSSVPVCGEVFNLNFRAAGITGVSQDPSDRRLAPVVSWFVIHDLTPHP